MSSGYACFNGCYGTKCGLGLLGTPVHSVLVARRERASDLSNNLINSGEGG